MEKRGDIGPDTPDVARELSKVAAEDAELRDGVAAVLGDVAVDRLTKEDRAEILRNGFVNDELDRQVDTDKPRKIVDKFAE